MNLYRKGGRGVVVELASDCTQDPQQSHEREGGSTGTHKHSQGAGADSGFRGGSASPLVR